MRIGCKCQSRFLKTDSLFFTHSTSKHVFVNPMLLTLNKNSHFIRDIKCFYALISFLYRLQILIVV